MDGDSEEESSDDGVFPRPSPQYWESARDRDPALLTYAMREYLLGEKEVSDALESQTRQRIRDRIRNGLLDFELLLCTLDDQDVQTIFSSITDDYRAMGNREREVYDGTKHTLAFLYFALSEFSQSDFEDIVENAIRSSSQRSSERRRGPHQWRAEANVDINVDWEIRAWRNDKLMEKLHSDEFLNERELGMVVRFGDLDEEDWELIREEIAEGPPEDLSKDP
jgi:hypothetical protein